LRIRWLHRSDHDSVICPDSDGQFDGRAPGTQRDHMIFPDPNDLLGLLGRVLQEQLLANAVVTHFQDQGALTCPGRPGQCLHVSRRPIVELVAHSYPINLVWPVCKIEGHGDRALAARFVFHAAKHHEKQCDSKQSLPHGQFPIVCVPIVSAGYRLWLP
jgi:hypothetical protein